MDIVSLAIQLLSGAGGGHLAGNMFKSLALSGLEKTVAGVVGGGLGAQVINSMLGAGAAATATAASGEPDLGQIISQIVGGGVGGGLMTAGVGILKGLFHKPHTH